MKRWLGLIPLMVMMSCMWGGVLSMAHAERAAVFFIECEHEEAEMDSIGEVAFVWATQVYLSSSYDAFYWLVNTDATRDRFMETMIEAVDAYPAVDLYLMAHGGTQFIWGHYDTRIDTDDVLALGAFENMANLRFVYDGSCYGYDQTDEFMAIGADSAIGNVSLNSNEIFYPSFACNFRKRTGADGEDESKTLREAVEGARKVTESTDLMDFHINGDENMKMTTDH